MSIFLLIIFITIIQKDHIFTNNIEDNRSVHNEADIQKINDLESELNEQKIKLDKILELLGKNNLI